MQKIDLSLVERVFTGLGEVAADHVQLVSRLRQGQEWLRQAAEACLVEVTCVWCGHGFPPGTPKASHQLLFDHSKTCPKHPMRRVFDMASEGTSAAARDLAEAGDAYHAGRLHAYTAVREFIRDMKADCT